MQAASASCLWDMQVAQLQEIANAAQLCMVTGAKVCSRHRAGTHLHVSWKLARAAARLQQAAERQIVWKLHINAAEYNIYS